MEVIPYIEFILPLLFFVAAFAYSSVGLGGGSSYTALMVVVGMSTIAIPMISLSLNLFVTTISSYNFLRNKHGRLHIVFPFLISAIPMAYLGGMLQLPKDVFLWILLVSLVVVAMRIYLWENTGFRINLSHKQKVIISLFTGSILGLLAGIVGIGGGIYLVPLIIMLKIGNEKEAAATGAIFVWVVSLSGLVSRLQYNSIDLTNYITLIVAVIIGAVIGSHVGSTKFSPQLTEKILGIVVLLAIVFLLKKLLF